MAVLAEQRKSSKKALLLLDAGNLFISKSRRSCDKRGKVEEILNSYRSMSYDAINLSQSDLVLGTSFLAEKANSLKLPFISSNLVAKKTGKPLFNRFIKKKVGESNVAIFGLMEQVPAQNKDNTYVTKNPFDAVRKMISSLRGKADLNIVLSSLSREKNVELLKEILDIDFIISTDTRIHAPTSVKNGYILSSGDKGKYLGRLDIRLSSLERPLRLQDIDRKVRLKSNLTRLRQRITKLKEKRTDILASDNNQIKASFNQEIERLQGQEKQYREKLAQLDKVKNYFTNSLIPLAAKKRERTTKRLSSRKVKGKARAERETVIGPGPHIKIKSLRANTGQKVTFVLLIDNAPNEVKALGFDVGYDPKVLKYSKYVRGELVNKFDMFDAGKLKEGLLRVGGFEARNDLVVAGKSGELMRLDFEVIGQGVLTLKIENLKDDVRDWLAGEATGR